MHAHVLRQVRHYRASRSQKQICERPVVGKEVVLFVMCVCVCVEFWSGLPSGAPEGSERATRPLKRLRPCSSILKYDRYLTALTREMAQARPQQSVDSSPKAEGAEH